MKKILMASTAILLAVAAWKTMSSPTTPKATTPQQTQAAKDKIDKRISVGILIVAASVEKVEDVEKKNVGKTYELSLGAVIAEPVEHNGNWRVLIGTENLIRLGACACVFDKKPLVEVGQMVTPFEKSCNSGGQLASPDASGCPRLAQLFHQW